jgi:uncharacterized membrane protein YeaQ/YmgE (transglycosylase-associated protein family)
MKHMENWMDFISLFIGMIGALLKGLKKKFAKTTIVLGMIIAGVLTYSFIGLVEMFFHDLSTKVLILISFCIGWIANEITEKLDELVGDFYEIFIGWIRIQFSRDKNKNHENKNDDPK